MWGRTTRCVTASMRSNARFIWARSFGETELVSALKLTDLYWDARMSTLGAHHKVRDGLDAKQHPGYLGSLIW